MCISGLHDVLGIWDRPTMWVFLHSICSVDLKVLEATAWAGMPGCPVLGVSSRCLDFCITGSVSSPEQGVGNSRLCFLCCEPKLVVGQTIELPVIYNVKWITLAKFACKKYKLIAKFLYSIFIIISQMIIVGLVQLHCQCRFLMRVQHWDESHKSRNVPVPHRTIHLSEQKWAHFCPKWNIGRYGTDHCEICELGQLKIKGNCSDSDFSPKKRYRNQRSFTTLWSVTKLQGLVVGHINTRNWMARVTKFACIVRGIPTKLNSLHARLFWRIWICNYN